MPGPIRCYRLTRRPYMALDGEGARRVGNRWNSRGRPAVYATRDPALTVLETLVHLDLPPELMPDDYVLLEIDLPALAAGEIEQGPDPVPDDAECRRVGDDFLARGTALILNVPSIIVPISRNLVLNPLHPRMGEVAVKEVHPFAFDSRLLQATP